MLVPRGATRDTLLKRHSRGVLGSGVTRIATFSTSFFKFVDLCRQCCGTRDKHEKGQDEAQTKYVRDHTRPTQRSEGRERKGNEQEWLRDGSVGTDGTASGDRSEGRNRGRHCPSSGARIYGQQWDRPRRLSRVAQPRAPEADTLRWPGPGLPTQPVCEVPFDNATTNESLMDPKGKMADESRIQTKRRHRHPEGRSLSHISPINTVKPVLISTSAAMRGFMQLRDMMIMAIMMQRVLGQPRTHEKGVDQWPSSGWQQSTNEQSKDEGWEEGEWRSSEVAQCHTDGRVSYRDEVSKLSPRSQEAGKKVVVRPRWNERDQENLEWADKKNLQWEIESKKRGAGGNR